MNPTPSNPKWNLKPIAWGLLGLLVLVKLLLHGITANSYGYFRDELYFLDCARHMSWGYVDDAPVIAGLFKVAIWLGGSLWVIRMIAAVLGVLTIALTMAIARELGGGRFAQGLAGLCALSAPLLLCTSSILSVSGPEALTWAGMAFLLARFIRTGDAKLWLWMGVVAGLGLETKYSFLVFLLALLVAFLFTSLRRELTRPRLWAGMGIMLLLFLPTLLWQIHHGFPLVEDMENIRSTGKNVVLGPWAFLKQQIMFLNPFLFPVWFAGLVFFFRKSDLRVFGWLYLGALALMMALHGKDYYLAAIYPMLFAAGGVAFERGLESPAWKLGHTWPTVAICSLIIAVTALLVPALLPFLPPQKLVAYQARLGLHSDKTETSHEGPLEQRFGDQFGWKEMAEEVAVIYHALPPEEQARTAIYAANYGEAGAMNQFGPALGLPQVICAHQAHSLWGTPTFKGDTFICLGFNGDGLKQAFHSVEQVGIHHNPWGMEEENGPIYLAKVRNIPLQEAWPHLKHWN